MNYLWTCLLALLLVTSGCSNDDNLIQNPEVKSFDSKQFGFTFQYPLDWSERIQDLPNNWAISRGQDTIIFMVRGSDKIDLLELGKRQAMSDTIGNSSAVVSKEVAEQVYGMVTLTNFNDQQWYTYAIEFKGESVDSIISGTLCGSHEILMVLVSSIATYDQNKETYTKLLESFTCNLQ